MQVCKNVKSFVSILLEDFEELVKVGWVKPVCVRTRTGRRSTPNKKGIEGFDPLNPSLTVRQFWGILGTSYLILGIFILFGTVCP